MTNFSQKLKISYPAQLTQILTFYFKSIDTTQESHLQSIQNLSGRQTPERNRLQSARQSQVRAHIQKGIAQLTNGSIIDERSATSQKHFDQKRLTTEFKIIITGIQNEMRIIEKSNNLKSFSINDQDLLDKEKQFKQKKVRQLDLITLAQQRRKFFQNGNNGLQKSQFEKFLLESDKAINYMEDQEEENYMKAGKQIRLRKIQKRMIENQMSYVLQQKKLNKTLIEQFERKELDFMNVYLSSSNNNINQIQCSLTQTNLRNTDKTLSHRGKAQSQKRGRNSENKFNETNAVSTEMRNSQTLTTNMMNTRAKRHKKPINSSQNQKNINSLLTSAQSYNQTQRKQSKILLKSQYQGFINNDLNINHPYMNQSNISSTTQNNNNITNNNRNSFFSQINSQEVSLSHKMMSLRQKIDQKQQSKIYE